MAETVLPQAAGVTGARGGKPTAFTARVPANVREGLENLARAEGKTIGQVATDLLQEALSGRATYADRLGGIGPAAAIESLVDAAVLVRETLGDPSESALARSALLAAWGELAPARLVLPLREHGRREAVRAELAIMQAAELLRKALPEGAVPGAGAVEKAALRAPRTPEEMQSLIDALDMLSVQKISTGAVEALRLATLRLAGIEEERLAHSLKGSFEGRRIAQLILAQRPVDGVQT